MSRTWILTGTGISTEPAITAGNILTGNAGNNILDGGAGADRMSGGVGDDTYVVDNAGDTAIESSGGGADTVRASVSFALGDNIETLVLTGINSIDGTGNGLANTILGNIGDNVLDGGAGADLLIGGRGNDTYVIDNSGDIVVENADGGRDTVLAAISYALGANLEVLALTGTEDLNGTGNSLANVILGNAGNNILDGGAGADDMQGGLGDDTYVVDRSDDLVTEEFNSGTDTVVASAGFILSDHIENLVLSGNGNFAGTGNALSNVLTGNSGDNLLDGGAGADTMRGGAGDDTYVVDDSGDKIIESNGEGHDTVRSSVSFTLGDNVENLVLTGASINGTGNALANVLTGNGATTFLMAVLGGDAMAGGDGDDTYVVDNAGDGVTENAGEGTDTVRAR